MAISGEGTGWFLVNASPDLRSQFETFAPLQPAERPLRNSPLEGVLLTNGDLDHTLGLLLLREGNPLHLHASEKVRKYLNRTLAFGPILEAFCGLVWHKPPSAWAPLPRRDGKPSGLAYRAIVLRSPPPVFGGNEEKAEESLAYLFRDERTGRTLLVAPDVFEMNDELEKAVEESDAVLFDGTFWSDDELGTVREAARKSSAMGHLPIRDGSLARLALSPARHRIYLHINNTNPILFPGSEERRQVEAAGVTIGCDGMEFEL